MFFGDLCEFLHSTSSARPLPQLSACSWFHGSSGSSQQFSTGTAPVPGTWLLQSHDPSAESLRAPRLPDSPPFPRQTAQDLHQCLFLLNAYGLTLALCCPLGHLGQSCGPYIFPDFLGRNRITEPIIFFMDPGRPKQPISTEMPTPGQSGLETVVRSHSAQLTKLNTELTSAFAQVTGEMGAFRAASASTSTALSSLSSQVAALTDLVTSLLPARVPEPNPSPPAVPPVAPTEPPLDPRWEPSLPHPKPYAGEFDRCRGFLGQCELLFCHQASRFRSDGARVALIMSSLTDRALDWAVAAVGRDP